MKKKEVKCFTLLVNEIEEELAKPKSSKTILSKLSYTADFLYGCKLINEAQLCMVKVRLIGGTIPLTDSLKSAKLNRKKKK